MIRKTATYKLVREWKLPGDLYRVLYAPDGRHLVTLKGNGTAYILRRPAIVEPYDRCHPSLLS